MSSYRYSRASFSELEVQSPVAAEALMTYVSVGVKGYTVLILHYT